MCAYVCPFLTLCMCVFVCVGVRVDVCARATCPRAAITQAGSLERRLRLTDDVGYQADDYDIFLQSDTTTAEDEVLAAESVRGRREGGGRTGG